MSLSADRRHWQYRCYEVIPGLLTWTTILAAVGISFWRPLWVIYFIIAFDLYWVFRVSYFIFYIALSWRRFRHDIAIDWIGEVKARPDWQRIRHLIFLPTYHEPLPVLRQTFQGLINSSYPAEKMIIVLAGEERGGRAEFLKKAKAIEQEFGHYFLKLIITIHPSNLSDEVPGKGSNLHHAGWQAKEVIDRLKIPYDNIVVSSFDIDTVAHPQYFACVTYYYLTSPEPTKASYQPIALYNNNMWESEAIVRVAAFGTTFWLMTDLMRPERLFTFSSHSMSWRMLVDIGFWEKDIVTEDSRIFLQGFLRYNGNYRVIPIFVPVSMNTVADTNWWQGLKSLYKQQRRWAWGVEHLPYMLWHFKKKQHQISRWKKFRYIWNIGEGMYSWATVPILIFILGRLPLFVASHDVKAIVVTQNTPFVLQWLMSFAMIGILISAMMSLALLPPRPKTSSRWRLLWMIVQWALLPVTLIIFGSIPATEAQTRLLLGGKFRLGFWVSPKKITS